MDLHPRNSMQEATRMAEDLKRLPEAVEWKWQWIRKWFVQAH